MAKSKPTTMNLAFSVSTSSSTVNSPTASKSLVILKAPCRTDWFQVQGNLTQEITITTQRRVLKNGKERCICGRKYRETCRPGYQGYPRTPGNSGDSEAEGNDKDWPHHLHSSPDYVLPMEKVFSIVRQRYGRSPTDEMKDLDENTAIRQIFMSVTLLAAVHLRKDDTINLRSTKNQPKKSFRELLQVTGRLITDPTEITGLTTIAWQQPVWRETTLLTDRTVQFATAKTCVFSDSVLCLGGISDEPVQAWESKIKWFLETRNLKDLDQIDGEPMEFEWTFFPDSQHWEFSTRFKKWLNQSANQSSSKERSSSCQCTMTLIGRKRRNKENSIANALRVTEYVEDSRKGVGSFWGLDPTRNGTDQCQQTWWKMGENCLSHDAQLCRKVTSSISCQQHRGKRRIEKQRKRSEHHSLQR